MMKGKKVDEVTAARIRKAAREDRVEIAPQDKTTAAIERILFMPEAWPKVGEQIRRWMLKGFPYALLYVQEEEEIFLTAVAHLHRGPKHYRDRVK